MRRVPPVGIETRNERQDEKYYKGRTVIGQITSVDHQNGVIQVRSTVSAESWPVQIPLYGFSMSGLRSSWMRYMPQHNDFVKLGFEPDNTPQVLSYAAFGKETDPGHDRSGSTTAPRQGGYATARRLAETNTLGMSIFRELKQGEFDMRSAGAAEIYGTRGGTLTLAGGGGANLRLIKARQEIKSRTGLTVFENDGVEVRFGDVKRKLLPTDAGESIPVLNPAGAAKQKEFSVRVAYPVPPLGTPKLDLYQHVAGDVRDSLGLPELNGGVPLRSKSEWSDPAGLSTTLSVKVDALGNVEVQQGPLALTGGVSINGGGTDEVRVTSLSTSFLTTSINSTTDGTMDSTLRSTVKGGVQVVLDAPLVSLGSATAIEPVIKGLSFSTTAVAPYVLAEGIFVGLLAPALAGLIALFASLGKTPLTNPVEIGALTAAAAGAGTFLPAIGAFGAGTAASLSLGVFTR